MTSVNSLLRSAAAPRRATFLELFFDLVFVVALALLSETLVTELTWRGVAEAVVVLLAVWWVWVLTTLVTDLYNPDSWVIQVVTVGVMFGALMMAAALPSAFGDRAGIFAGAYVASHLGRGFLFFLTLHEPIPRRRAVRIWAWFGISSVGWIAGAFADSDVRLWWWGGAAAVDYLAFAFGYPFPGRRRIGTAQFNPIAEHTAERYHQFFIIALGDIILVAGLTYSAYPVTADRTAAIVVAFASATLLFRIYVHRAAAQLTQAIEKAREPGRFARSAPYTHLLMIGGVVTAAASAKLIITEPAGTVGPEVLAVVVGGPAVFLLGRTRFEYEVFGRVAWPLLAGIALLGVLAPVALALTPLLAVVCANLVLLAIVLFDVALGGRRNPVPAAPPL
ncbi:low temperature requirement protein A [Verrucosispora sp. SN26_14.1]|uniref:low temperature requirement protein A n=1 Tax=Verrucosispora sp. SN26_14.1 TaxID=2527879 RepID=UPI001375FA9E|nr:low temperature requirement protein A [Verrucosispora sp. SN26_14.1]